MDIRVLTEIENRVVKQVNLDFMPLHDLVREFCGYESHPSDSDFIQAMKLLESLSIKYNWKFLKGPEMAQIDKPVNVIIDVLKQFWSSHKYSEIDYSIWITK